MKFLRAVLLVPALTAVACTGGPGRGLRSLEHDAVVAPLPDGIVPVHEALEVWIDPAASSFSGTAVVEIDAAAPHDRARLHGLGLEVDDVQVERDGRTVPGRWRTLDDAGTAEVAWSGLLPAGRSRVRVAFHGPYRAPGLTVTEHGGARYAIANFEPFGARRAFPCFDEPRFKIPFTIDVLTRREDTAAANGPLVSRSPAQGGWTRHHFAPTEPLATYQLAVAVGRYEHVQAAPIPPSARRPWAIPIAGFAAGRDSGGAWRALVESLPALVDWLEARVGHPIPNHAITLVEAPGLWAGAMESPGAILVQPIPGLRDGPNPVALDRARCLLAHELAHQWFGNAVTMARWEDLFLSEGFATWLENAYGAAHPELRATLPRFGVLLGRWSGQRPPRVFRDLTTLGQTEQAFDAGAYSKPGRILAAYETFLGEDRFREVITAYFARAKGGSATRDDLFRAVESVAGKKVATSLESDLARDDEPIVSGHVTCGDGPPTLDVRVRVADRADVRQVTSDLPLCIQSGFADGRTTTTCSRFPLGSMRWEPGWATCPSWVMAPAGGEGVAPFALDTDQARALVARGPERLGRSERVAALDGLFLGLELALLDGDTFFAASRALLASADEASRASFVLLAHRVTTWLRTSPARGPFGEALEGALAIAFSAAPSAAPGGLRGLAQEDLFYALGRPTGDRRSPRDAALRLAAGDASALEATLALAAEERWAWGDGLRGLAWAPPQTVPTLLDRAFTATGSVAARLVLVQRLLSRADTQDITERWLFAHREPFLREPTGNVAEALRQGISASCSEKLASRAQKDWGQALGLEAARVDRVRRCEASRERVVRAVEAWAWARARTRRSP